MELLKVSLAIERILDSATLDRIKIHFDLPRSYTS